MYLRLKYYLFTYLPAYLHKYIFCNSKNMRFRFLAAYAIDYIRERTLFKVLPPGVGIQMKQNSGPPRPILGRQDRHSGGHISCLLPIPPPLFILQNLSKI